MFAGNLSLSPFISSQFTPLQTKIAKKSPKQEWNSSLTHTCASLLEPRGSRLKLLKSTFNAENFIRRLSWSISSHFGAIHSCNACCSPKSRKNLLKPPILRVQGHSRSSMLAFLRSSLPVLVMISRMSVPIRNHFHVRRANSGRITFLRGVPLFLSLVRGNPFSPVA